MTQRTTRFTLAAGALLLATGGALAQIEKAPPLPFDTPQQMRDSDDPYVRQFVHAEADGPVPFHFAGRSIGEQLGLEGAK